MTGSTKAYMSLPKILKGTHSSDTGRWIATMGALRQIVWILRWRMQEMRKSQNKI